MIRRAFERAGIVLLVVTFGVVGVVLPVGWVLYVFVPDVWGLTRSGALPLFLLFGFAAVGFVHVAGLVLRALERSGEPEEW